MPSGQPVTVPGGRRGGKEGRVEIDENVA